MASFQEIRFPTDIDFGFVSGPMYNTDIISLFSGYEQRNINWQDSRNTFTATNSIKTSTQIAAVIAFFRAMRGRAYGFRFRDWTDYIAYAQPIGTGDGTTTVFQLSVTYNAQGVTKVRTITKPVASGNQITTVPNFYLNSVLQTTGYTLDYTTGLVTFSSAPTSGVAITADFEFDVPVRFDFDNIKIRHEYNHEFYIDSLTLIEIKEPESV